MSATSKKVLKNGDYLFREGEVSRSLYLIQKGSLAVRKAKGSAFVEIARLYSNEVVGELSFFDRKPRSASAIALTELEVLEITFESLDKIYQNVPDYMKTIMTSVADRLRKADDIIRRLQKDLVTEGGGNEESDSNPSAEDILASTANIDVSSGENLDAEAEEEDVIPGDEEPQS